jgi:hypothetical protein
MLRVMKAKFRPLFFLPLALDLLCFRSHHYIRSFYSSNTRAWSSDFHPFLHPSGLFVFSALTFIKKYLERWQCVCEHKIVSHFPREK